MGDHGDRIGRTITSHCIELSNDRFTIAQWPRAHAECGQMGNITFLRA